MVEIGLDALYGRMRPSPFGTALLILCVLISMSEGYDVQAMGVAAPIIAKAWTVRPGAMGALLASAVVGQIAGAYLLSPLGDRVGRRPAVLAGLTIAGIATLGCAAAPSYALLMAARFVAGIGLGLAISNTFTLAMEVVPLGWRSFAVVLVGCGYPLGAAAGAGAASQFIPAYGIAAVFGVGGIATIAITAVTGLALVESPVILARRAGGQPRLRTTLARLGLALAPDTIVVPDRREAPRSRVAALFAPDRRAVTSLLWLLSFAAVALVYFFLMWLPSLLASQGMSPGQAATATSLFSGAGVVGALLIVAAMQAVGPVRALGTVYILTIAAVLVFASVHGSGTEFHLALAVCGATIIGSQFGLNAVVNGFYPDDIRATGAGYAAGAGRIGAIFAPLVGAAVLTHVASPASAFAVGAVPAALSLFAIILLGRQPGFSVRRKAARA